MKTVDTTSDGRRRYSPLIPAVQAFCQSHRGEQLEFVLDDAWAFNELKEFLIEQEIGFREIYDGDKMVLQFTR